MSKDQVVKPAVTSAIAAAAANTTPAMQNRISVPSYAGSLTETSLQALNGVHPSGSFGPCTDDTDLSRLAVDDLPIMSWLRDREDIRAFWMSYGGEKRREA